MSDQTVREIQAFIQGEAQLPRDRLEQWARSEDPAVIESAMDAVSVANDRIVPPVDELGYFELLLVALRLSLTREEEPKALSPYLLGMDFLSFLDDAKGRLGTDAFLSIVGRLERELRSLVGDLSPLGKRTLVDGFLEHLLERDDLRSLFEPWKADATLAPLYLEAEKWASSVRSSRESS